MRRCRGFWGKRRRRNREEGEAEMCAVASGKVCRCRECV